MARAREWPAKIPNWSHECVDAFLGKDLQLGSHLGSGLYGDVWSACTDSERKRCPYIMKQSRMSTIDGDGGGIIGERVAADIAARLGVGPQMYRSTMCTTPPVTTTPGAEPTQQQQYEYSLAQRLSGPTLASNTVRNPEDVKHALDLYYRLLREGHIEQADFHDDNLMFDDTDVLPATSPETTTTTTTSQETKATTTARRRRRLYLIDYGLARAFPSDRSDKEALEAMHVASHTLFRNLVRTWIPPPTTPSFFPEIMEAFGESSSETDPFQFWNKLTSQDRDQLIEEFVQPYPKRHDEFQRFLLALDTRSRQRRTLQEAIDSWFAVHESSS